MGHEMKYTLGRDVTEQAKAKESRKTVVISFRIKPSEFDRLSDLAVRDDRTVSEVARMAFRLGVGQHFIPVIHREDTAGNPATWTQ